MTTCATETKLTWSEDAKAMIPIIPELFRDTAVKMIEKSAMEKGLSEVTAADMAEARERIFKMMQVKEKPALPTARDFLGWQIPRIMTQAADSITCWVDVDRVLDRITDKESWVREWSALGEQFENFGEKAISENHGATARVALGAASNYYRLAQFTINEANPVKKNLVKKSVDTFTKAGEFHIPAIEPIEIPFNDLTLPGYFQPAKDKDKAPCIVIIHGADSTKEEMLINMRMAHLRGFATATIDGPGQSEARLRGALFTADGFSKAVSNLIDYLVDRPEVDSDNIAIWGVCLGGTLALQATAADNRVKACVDNNGPFSFGQLVKAMPPAWISSINYMAGYGAEDGPVQELLDSISAEDAAPKITCPVLLVHGVDDPIVPASQCEAIYEKLGGPKEMFMNEGGDHCSANVHSFVWPKMFDWLADTLGTDANA